MLAKRFKHPSKLLTPKLPSGMELKKSMVVPRNQTIISRKIKTASFIDSLLMLEANKTQTASSARTTIFSPLRRRIMIKRENVFPLKN